MPAYENLNPQQFLHGSPVRIPTGDEILPASKISTPEHIERRRQANPEYKSNRVYMTPFPTAALQYTWTEEDITKQNKEPSGYIHVVEPIGRTLLEKGQRDAVISRSRYSRGARVVGSFPAKTVITGKVDTEEEKQAYENYMSRTFSQQGKDAKDPQDVYRSK
jgi:hypothetical protein